MKRQKEWDDDIATPEIEQKMIELDTIIEVQFYPDTPVGFYKVYHYDLDMALDEALSCLNPRQLEPQSRPLLEN